MGLLLVSAASLGASTHWIDGKGLLAQAQPQVWSGTPLLL